HSDSLKPVQCKTRPSRDASGGRTKRPALKKTPEGSGRFIRDADDFVCCLPIEFEIELGLGSTVVPVPKNLELAPSQAPLRQRATPNGDAHPRRLTDDAAFLCDRFGRADNTARDETLPALVLAREDKQGVAFGDLLTAVHRLLREKRERLRPWIGNLSFDRERAAFHLPTVTGRQTQALVKNESFFADWNFTCFCLLCL